MTWGIEGAVMTHAPQHSSDPVVAASRRRARRTALLFGGLALALYLGFILLGALHS